MFLRSIKLDPSPPATHIQVIVLSSSIHVEVKDCVIGS